jgi:hypothetical protein
MSSHKKSLASLQDGGVSREVSSHDSGEGQVTMTIPTVSQSCVFREPAQIVLGDQEEYS